MRGLIRAEWLRLRRRRDIWLVGLALAALTIPAYASGLSSAESMIHLPPGEELPPEVIADIEAQYRAQLARYAFPASIGTVVETGQILVLALVAYLAAATTGAEFAYGTIRTSLVARADRVGFVLVRLATMAVIALALIGLLVGLGAVLPFAAALLGRDWPAGVEADLGLILAPLGVLALAAGFVIGLTSLWAILTRNAAIALVLTIAYVFIDGAIQGLIVRAAGGDVQAPVAWFLPIADLQRLFQRASGGTPGESFPTLAAIAVVVGWIVAGWAASVWTLGRVDVKD